MVTKGLTPFLLSVSVEGHAFPLSVWEGKSTAMLTPENGRNGNVACASRPTPYNAGRSHFWPPRRPLGPELPCEKSLPCWGNLGERRCDPPPRGEGGGGAMLCSLPAASQE